MRLVFIHMLALVMGRIGGLAITIVAFGFALDGHLGHAADGLSIADFVGHFRGEAQVESGDRFFIQQLRDAEVDLRTEPDGFRLAWTTIIHLRRGRQNEGAPTQGGDAVHCGINGQSLS